MNDTGNHIYKCNKMSSSPTIISFCYTAFRVHPYIHTINNFFKWSKDTIKLLKNMVCWYDTNTKKCVAIFHFVNKQAMDISWSH